jgi:MoxR-like ATPase
MTEIRTSPDAVVDALASRSYLADRSLATVLYLALELGKPLLLEGEAGVGKTELAKVTADALGARLIRLQCYEGIDVAHALYDWAYAKQMLYIRTLEATGHAGDTDVLHDLFGKQFLERRPLLDAIDNDDDVPPVLLIDEIDRADDEFEALLLEALGEGSVTVPEIGTFTARQPPIVVLTSNRSRELHDALRRRCLYHWLEFPEPERVVAILRRTAPAASAALVESAAQFVGHVRSLDLEKPPGVAEAINWVAALSALGATELVREVVVASVGAVVKTPDDREAVLDSLDSYAFG